MGNELAPMQKKFCQEHIIDLNATQAAIRAGYSVKTAYSQGQRLLKNVEVKREIQRLQSLQSERLERTADDVLRDIQEVGQEARQAGEFNNALKALELEGKHKGMFKEKIEISGDLSINNILQEGIERVKSAR